MFGVYVIDMKWDKVEHKMGLKYNRRCSPVVFYKCFNSNIHNPNHDMIDMLAADINYIFMCLFSVPESYPRSEQTSPPNS